jgi:dCMP deaminase
MRPSRDTTMMEMARAIAKRSTCPRREVGAVLVDANGRVLSCGHNGVAMGEPHCSEGHPCGGESFEHGVGLVQCKSAHAEMNALLFCNDVMRIDTLYVTASPCELCVRYFLNTSCSRIVFYETYSQPALDRWKATGRTWAQVAPEGKLLNFNGPIEHW